MKKLNGILWGIVLIAVGVIIALSGLGILAINIFFEGWWTLFIIVPCTIGLITDRDKTGSIIGICVGVLLLLCCRKIMNFVTFWKLIIPAIIIIIGIRMIMGSIFSKKDKEVFKTLKCDQNAKSTSAVFSKSNLDFGNNDFTGAELSAVFGGIECNLKDTLFKGDGALKATAVFGGIEIYVPEGVEVKINCTGVFGGAEDQRVNKQSGQHTLYIDAVCVFGGITVK